MLTHGKCFCSVVVGVGHDPTCNFVFVLACKLRISLHTIHFSLLLLLLLLCLLFVEKCKVGVCFLCVLELCFLVLHHGLRSRLVGHERFNAGDVLRDGPQLRAFCVAIPHNNTRQVTLR